MDYSTYILTKDERMIVIVVIASVFLFFVFYINLYLPFQEEKNYIKMEMARSSEEKDYLFWKSELKRLYLSKIPIIGRFFR